MREAFIASPLLRERIALDGFSQADIARSLDVDQAYICRIVQGQKAVAPPNAERLARCLGISLTVAVDEGLFVREGSSWPKITTKSRVKSKNVAKKRPKSSTTKRSSTRQGSQRAKRKASKR